MKFLQRTRTRLLLAAVLTATPLTGHADTAIYEPFDYPSPGNLNGQGGTSDFGFDGNWSANSDSTIATSDLVDYPSFTWGSTTSTLATTGKGIAGLGGGSNRFGGARSVWGATDGLADLGLLDDGSRLWFSALVGYDIGGNRTNSRLLLVIGDDQLNSGNFNYWMDGSGTTGLGVTLGRFGNVNGKLVATQARDASFGDGTAGNVYGTVAASFYPGSNANMDVELVVGKITWAADPADPDTIEIFQVEPDLGFPTTPISTLQVTVDQSGYDTISWCRGDKVVLDEIRYGASFNDVAPAIAPVADLVAPTPDPASFAVAPTAVTDAIVTMTATTAIDPSGVEYLFTNTTIATTSGWQSSPLWTETGLTPETEYFYTVVARDLSAAQNSTVAATAVSVTTPAVDFAPPLPNPMTFAVNPAPVSNTEITMTATTATDDTYGVEYLFTNTTIATTSGWQSSTVYTEGGLTPNTTYNYTVTARDTGPLNNTGTASGSQSASTFPTDTTPPAPTTWATPPSTVSDTSITMTATTATDDQYGVEYYFANLSVPSGANDSGWQASPTYTDTGLTPFASYTYELRVRDTGYAQNSATGDPLPAVTDPDPAIVVPALSEGLFYTIGSQNISASGPTPSLNVDISVFPGSAIYSGVGNVPNQSQNQSWFIYNYFGDGTVLDYKFFGENGTTGSILNYAAGSEGLISVVTTPDTNVDDAPWADVWATSDPGFDFTANPADFTSDTFMTNVSPSITGSIDISQMSEGIVYIVFGAYRNRPNVDIVMSGAGQTDVTLDNIGDDDGANNNENYVCSFSFQNAEDYDTITYVVNSSNGRFMGAVLDGTLDVGPPATAYSDWAASQGLTAGVNDFATSDADSGGQNNFYEFAFGGDPLDGNDDGALMHVFTADADADTDADGVLTVLVRAGATWTYSGPAATASVDGVNYTIAGSATIPVSGAVNVLEGTTVITTGLDPAPFGYEYKSFILDGSVSEGLGEGYFQATAEPTP